MCCVSGFSIAVKDCQTIQITLTAVDYLPTLRAAQKYIIMEHGEDEPISELIRGLGRDPDSEGDMIVLKSVSPFLTRGDICCLRLASTSLNSSFKWQVSGFTPIVVRVGLGDRVQAFMCCREGLVFQSPYFRRMLRLRLGLSTLIEEPGLDPEAWKVFCQFVDPYKIIRKVRYYAPIDDENASKLLPLFRKYEMVSFVEKCVEILSGIGFRVRFRNEKSRRMRKLLGK